VFAVISVSNVTALLQCLTLIRQHRLTTADVTVQDLKIANYGNLCVIIHTIECFHYKLTVVLFILSSGS